MAGIGGSKSGMSQVVIDNWLPGYISGQTKMALRSPTDPRWSSLFGSFLFASYRQIKKEKGKKEKRKMEAPRSGSFIIISITGHYSFFSLLH